MEITSIKLAYFSPTGTTEKVARGIAAGLNTPAVETIDITSPEVRKQALKTAKDELLLIAAPVYMGRIPAVLTEWLNSIQADGTPTVCVVVYGNRVYDDALLELKNITAERGCIPIAGAAYIGEHSFSDPDTPTAHGRPDVTDLKHAEDLGRKIREKLQAVTAVSEIPEIEVPGEFPYRGQTTLWDVDFIAVDDSCTQCGHCAEICPVGAIDSQDSSNIDLVKCISCCACIKRCPESARSIKEGPVLDARKRLNNLFSEPKQPEYYL